MKPAFDSAMHNENAASHNEKCDKTAIADRPKAANRQ